MFTVQSLWRWVRLPLAVMAVCVFALTVWAAWLLSDQRYQIFLTEQLSTLLVADVRVENSHFSLRRGLGITLEGVTVREHPTASPLVTVDAVNVLLDISSLFYGQVLFRQIEIIRPHLRVIENETQQALVHRLRGEVDGQQPVDPQSEGWFAPTFALQYLTVEDGTIIYRRATSPTVLFLTQVGASFASTRNEGITAQLETALGQNGELGKVTLQTRAPGDDSHIPLSQREWQGDVALVGMRVRQLGRALAMEWPQAILDFTGSYQGRWTGPVELTGLVSVRDTQVGAVRISQGSARLEKLRWPGPSGVPPASLQASLFSTLEAEARVEDIQGVVGDTWPPIVLRQGAVALRNKELVVTGLQGTVGTGSQLLEGTGTVTQLFVEAGPTLDLRVVVLLDLAKDIEPALAVLAARGEADLSSQVAQPQGHAQVQLDIQTKADAGSDRKVTYEGAAEFQQAAVRLPSWNIPVTEISGSIRIAPQALTADSLTGRVGGAPVQVQGTIQNYLSAQRDGEVRFTFAEIGDQTLAPLLPEGVVLARNGTLSGKVKLVLSPAKEIQTSGAVTLREVQLDPLTFLRPFTITVGELTWQGQSGAFKVTQGQLAGAAFIGRGRFSSVTPLHIEISLNFPALNLEQAFAIDKPRTDTPKPKTTTVVRVDLACDECLYRTLQAQDLRLAVHWHNRLAEIQVTKANVAGGQAQGEATFWPDLGSVFCAPHLTGVDMQRFFNTVGHPSDVLTGTLTGSGKIYVENWRRWATPASWDAMLSLNITNGVAKQVPLLVRLWSAVSLQGLLRLRLPALPNEGLAFSSLTGDVAMGHGSAVTKNVSLNGSAVQIEAQGEIDLTKESVNLLVHLAPLHGLTNALGWVPLVGDLLASGAEFLTSLSFRVTGPYEDPIVTPAIVDAVVR